MYTKISKINTNIEFVEGNIEKTIFNVLLAMIIISFFSYFYFINSTIFNIIGRKNIESENRTLSSNISELELQYLSATNNIDLDFAHSIGFKDASNAKFASASKFVSFNR